MRHFFVQYCRWPMSQYIALQACAVITICISLLTTNSIYHLIHQSNFRDVLGTTTVNVTVSSGSLSLTAPASANLSSVTLSASNQSSSGSMGAITVEDNRGSGAGWTLTTTATDFTCCNPTRTIGVTNVRITPGSVTTNAGTANVTAGTAHTFTTTTDQATLMSAGTDQGMGSYSVSPTLNLTVPMGSYNGSYSGTITTTAS